jgi:predicted ribosome quality control (RQC) complex YloA/Tae2 family protein
MMRTWIFCSLILLVEFHNIESFLLHLSPRTHLRVSPQCRQSDIHLYGVLSKTAILRGVRKKNSSSFRKFKHSSSSLVSRPFLIEATDEALLRQQAILEALELESEKPTRNKLRLSIVSRKKEINDIILNLQILKQRLRQGEKEKFSNEELEKYKHSLIDLGFQKILNQSPDCWKSRRKNLDEYGKPRGFDGLLFYSPLGVPILVGKPKAHKDETLRRISQGADLWFQVEGYNGSRVLLRTSLKRGLRGSKECMQMAADLAAAYCDQGDTLERTPVMYTDSKHVAKRGSKVGQMRQQKSFGRMYGYPRNVEDMIHSNFP